MRSLRPRGGYGFYWISRLFEPFTAEEARRFLAAIEGDRWQRLFELALRSGLRRGELLGVEVERPRPGRRHAHRHAHVAAHQGRAEAATHEDGRVATAHPAPDPTEIVTRAQGIATYVLVDDHGTVYYSGMFGPGDTVLTVAPDDLETGGAVQSQRA